MIGLRRALASPLLSPSRTYAVSRFPKRATGTSRARERVQPRQINDRNDQQEVLTAEIEETPSEAQSPLWHTSQRPPASNPQEGLTRLLQNDVLVVERQIEMLNIFVGFEQANKYSISDENGTPVGYIAEEPRGFLGTLSRQAFATHRPFRALIMDAHGSPVLWLRRPFSWINSRMYVQRLKNFSEYTPQGEPVLDTFAEVQQTWHLWRRKYDMFVRESQQRILSPASHAQPEPETSIYTQFSKVDAGLLAWDFRLIDRKGHEFAQISRAFRGFGREIFTDTGQYAVRFGFNNANIEYDQPHYPRVRRHMSLDERAAILALAINIDFDYFSRHSGHGGGLFHFQSWD